MQNDIMILIKDICKSFPTVTGDERLVLENVNLAIKAGEIICILGYSGCGKTTLLRIVSAIEKPTSGEIWINGKAHSKPSRNALLLFQDFNQLFPWKTVYGNIIYPILSVEKGVTKAEAHERANELICAVGLDGYQDSYPHQLSGGMKQRAAVARCLALRPSVLLMDEPFASLDATTRSVLQRLTVSVCHRYSITAMMVTHSVEEALIMGDRIAIMTPSSHRIQSIINNYDYEKQITDKTEKIAQIINFMNSKL